MTITRHYTVTSFDSAFYFIPPFKVYVDSVPYNSDGLALAFFMFDLESSEPDAFIGPKDIMKMPLEWQDVKVSVYGGVAFILLLLLVLFLQAILGEANVLTLSIVIGVTNWASIALYSLPNTTCSSSAMDMQVTV